jgi:hypothetical protein
MGKSRLSLSLIILNCRLQDLDKISLIVGQGL